MLDSFFSKGFKAAKCKTLLKLTIPRIKLLRNRREIHLKQMRKDIANLLENGQEATARIRIEHVIREENMMAAQEIIELFCELIAIRLPIIEMQRECPLDLKEAISSLCFAAPRCSDLPELLQVQMSFAAKYGKEFVVAASELMPDCGVNRQIIQLLSVQAPSVETKLKLLKDIAEEHEVDWDPATIETEFLKPHEDLLTSSCPALPLPKEKCMSSSKNSISGEDMHKELSLDSAFDSWNLPEVPKGPVQSNTDSPQSPTSNFQPPLPPPFYSHTEHEEAKTIPAYYFTAEPKSESLSPKLTARERQHFIPIATPSSPSPPPPLAPSISLPPFFQMESSPPSTSPPSAFQTESSHLYSQIKLEAKQEDLQDVLTAAQAAAESAERAASAARAAASLAQVRITELLTKKKPQDVYHGVHHETSDEENLTWSSHSLREEMARAYMPNSNSKEMEADLPNDAAVGPEYDTTNSRPQRSVSIEDDLFFSYPNLFSRQESNLMARFDSPEKSRPTHGGA